MGTTGTEICRVYVPAIENVNQKVVAFWQILSHCLSRNYNYRLQKILSACYKIHISIVTTVIADKKGICTCMCCTRHSKFIVKRNKKCL